jgi:GT2 family glycosyltransferase
MEGHATASFDVFDTLLVRPVADPHDVFRLVERDLDAPGWAAARIAAETVARRAKPSLEVTLDEIYAAAPLQPWAPRREEFRGRELAWESHARIDPAAAARVAAARSAGARILYISDTYFPREFLRERLAPVWRPGDTLLLSHESGDSKGRTWWAKLAAEYPQPWHHVGDHPHSDVAAPARHGISTERWTRSRPNARECALMVDNPQRPLAAGLARFARLTGPVEAHALWEDGANVAGPVFHGFVRWVLQTAASHRAECVFFLARDGQLPHRIAEVVRAADPSLPAARYLHGSRHAWYLALFDPQRPDHRAWVAHAPAPTIRGVLENLELEPGEVAAALRRAGYAPEDWDRPRTFRERQRVLELLATDAEASAVFAARRNVRLELTLAYFRREGVFAHRRVVLVDIGWSGSMLDAFQQLIAQHEGVRPEVLGCFFGLHRNGGPDRFTYFLKPGFWPHWLVAFPSVVEMLAPADHGQTIGYQAKADGSVGPELNSLLVASPAGIAALHAGALRYVKLAIETREPPPACDRLLRAFIVRPDAAQRARWAEFRFWTWQRPAADAGQPLFDRVNPLLLLLRVASPWRNVAAWPWPTATLAATWPWVPGWLCSALTWKFQLDRMGWALFHHAAGILRAVKLRLRGGPSMTSGGGGLPLRSFTGDRCGAVVVAFFPDAEIAARLRAVAAEVRRLVVIDNTPYPGGAPTLAGTCANIGAEYSATGRNRGLAGALNEAFGQLASSGCDWAIAFDQDSMPEPGLCRALGETAVDARGAWPAVVGSNWVDEGRPGSAARHLCRGGWPLLFARVPAERDLAAVTCVIASGSLFNLAVWRALGGFDEGLFLDLVDADYCLRAAKRGYDVRVSARARLRHRRGAKRAVRFLGRTWWPAFMPPLRLRYLFRNRVRLVVRHGIAAPHWVFFELVYAAKIVAEIVFLEDAKLPKLAACVRGTWDGLLGRKGSIAPDRVPGNASTTPAEQAKS